MKFVFDPSLVLYLPLYELDGASFISKDKHGHLCTVTGALWQPDGRAFDGTDDNIIGTGLSGLPTTEGSLEVWIKFSDLSRGEVWFDLVKDGDEATHRVALWHDATNVYLGTAGDVFKITVAHSGILTEGIFYHIVGTWNTTTDNYELFVDAVSKGTSVVAEGDMSFDKLVLGERFNAIGQFTGIIGEARIYSRALTPLEIQHNYLATKWRYR